MSFANAIIIPPKNVRKPLALCCASCDFKDKPIWTIPKPRRISPIAFIAENMKVDILFIAASGSSANTGVAIDIIASVTISMNFAMLSPFFILTIFFCVFLVFFINFFII